MKILFFTNEYSHEKLPSCGGVGTFLKILAEELNKQGHNVYIYGFSRKKIHFKDNGINFYFIKKYSKTHFISEFIRSFGAKLNSNILQLYFLKRERKFLARKLKIYSKKHQIDIIESFVFGGYTAYWDNSTPLVLRFHGSRGFWHYYLGQKEDIIKILMEKKALEVTPYTIANSHFSAKFIKDYYNVEADITIPNGIDTTVFSPDDSIQEIPKSIFYAGTLSDAKGVNKLASIFNDIQSKHRDASLHFIGRGEKYSKYLSEEILTKDALKNTRFYGHTPLHELPKLLLKASVIVIPTKGETFGFTIVEAMALKKIVIVSNIPVASEIIDPGKDGFIANDFNDFKKHIIDIFDTPDGFEKVKENARKKVLEKYTKTLMVERSIDYYTKILNN